jgi:hypothetical protein
MPATVNKNVKILGLDELERKLGYSVLLDPSIDEVVNKFGDRIERPVKKAGLGIRRNTVSRFNKPLAVTFSSTLHNPRQVGSSWQRKNEAIVKGMAPNVIKAAIRRIEETWSD